MFNWEKKGLVFRAQNQFDWMACYTSPLTGFLIDENNFRLYFSTRQEPDKNGNFVSRITFIDVDLENPSSPIFINNNPVLDIGTLGTFDENGTMVAEVLKFNDLVYMYYMGWQRGVNVPYYIQLGLALSSDNGITFEKVSKGPIIGISQFVPYGIGNVSVHIDDDKKWSMLYTDFTGWSLQNGTYNPNYHIKLARSEDGINWTFPGIDAVLPTTIDENIATPDVLRLKDGFHMWFSTRKAYENEREKGKYRIGYAFSKDFIHWNRNDDFGLNPGDYSWEKEMACYPKVIKYKDELIMFYCGNRYGRDGFGFAECKL